MFYLALSCQRIVTLSMLNQNNLGIMGITKWHLRDVIYTSAQHNACYFYASLVQPLTATQKTFLVKLYQAIEKLLKLNTISKTLTQMHQSQQHDNQSVKVVLKFINNCLAPNIKQQDHMLVIELPSVGACEKNAAVKSMLWKLLKDNIS